MSRALKKLLYGFFYLAFFASISILVFRASFRAEPTCFDSVQNQREAGVDCGGPCASCALNELTPLQVLSYRVFALSNDRATLLFSAINPNSTYHATRFSYHVDIFDKAGTRVEQFDGTDSLFANERKYLIEPRVSVRASIIGTVAITLSNPAWRSVAELAPPVLSLSNITTEVAPTGAIRVSGTASNKGSNAAYDVKVLAIVSNKYSSIFASQNTLTSLVGFQNASFTIPFPTDAIFKNVDGTKTEVFISNQ